MLKHLEDAPSVVFMGIQVYTWGLYCLFGAVLYLVFLHMRCRGRVKDGTAALCGVLSLALGFVFSRLFYCLFDARMRVFADLADGSLSFGEYAAMLLDPFSGGFSMFGALFGGCLGACAAAGILKTDRKALLDVLAGSLMLLVAAERLGEGNLEDFGISRPLSQKAGAWNLFILHGEYDDCIATYMLESLTAVILFMLFQWHLGRRRGSGETFVFALLWFGLTQVLMESLRFDQHMRFSFVGVQHLMAFGCAAGAMLTYAFRLRKKRPGSRLFLFAVLLIPLTVGALVGLEFMIDRSGVSKLLLYGIYILLLAFFGWTALRVRARAEDAA